RRQALLHRRFQRLQHIGDEQDQLLRVVPGPQQTGASNPDRRCAEGRPGHSPRSEYFRERCLVRRQSLSRPGRHDPCRRIHRFDPAVGHHREPADERSGVRLHVALAQRTRNHDQQRFSRRHAHDDARRLPGIRDRRIELVPGGTAMRSNSLKAIRIKSAFFACALLLAGGRALAAQQVNLTAGPVGLTLPDGSTVPMWGYSCGTAVGGSTATCAKLHPSATGWSPVVITVPTGQALTINLTNNLSFGSTPNTIPPSLVILGQLGGGLGDVTQRTVTAAPDHSNAQQLTWPIADPGTTGTPPTQGPRVQSFSTEVPAGATTALTWA